MVHQLLRLNTTLMLTTATVNRVSTKSNGTATQPGDLVARLGHPTFGLLADHRIELFPLLSGGEKLILMTSHEDVDLWTRQDDPWCLPWLGKPGDWSVGAIERDMRLLFLCHT